MLNRHNFEKFLTRIFLFSRFLRFSMRNRNLQGSAGVPITLLILQQFQNLRWLWNHEEPFSMVFFSDFKNLNLVKSYMRSKLVDFLHFSKNYIMKNSLFSTSCNFGQKQYFFNREKTPSATYPHVSKATLNFKIDEE